MQWAGQTSRILATHNVENFSDANLPMHAQSVRPIAAEWPTQEGGLKRNDTNQNFLKDAEIGFAEMNSVRIIRGIFYISACNPISSTPKCNY